MIGNKANWIRWGVIAAPVVVIGILTGVNRMSGPTAARAGNSSTAGDSAVENSGSLRKAERMEEWIASQKRPTPSPFPVVVTPATVQAVDEPVPAPDEDTRPQLEGVRLTGVFRSDDVAIAAINGKLRREGEFVRPGIKVTRIDARARVVVLTLADGQTVELRQGSQSDRK